MKKVICMLCVLALVLAVPVPASAQEIYTLPVFETSDIHGFLADTSSGVESTYQYRLAYIADKVDDARGGDAANTVLLDGGDIYQGNVVSNLQNGEPMMAAFDLMQYDAVALGNHEFDWGITNTTDPDGTIPSYSIGGLTADSRIPIVCSNIYYTSSGERVNFTQDYVIVDKTARTSGGQELPVRIAIIGYAENYSSSIMTAEIAPYTIRENLSAVRSLASALKSSGQADAVILLTHAGAGSMASSVGSSGAIDLVCGGHTHAMQAGVNGVSYIQAGAQATSYASAQLCFTADKSVSVSGESTHSVTQNPSLLYPIPANAGELSPAVAALSTSAIEGVSEALNTPLGYITTSVTKNSIGNNEMSSTAGNWMASLANRATGSAVSFTNSGGIRSNLYVNNGRRTVTMGDVYTIAPFGNLLYVYDVTYTELLGILSWSIGSGRGLSLRMAGIDCYYSGRTITALVQNDVCIYQDGAWLTGLENELIRVSTNEFVATSSGTPFYSRNDSSQFVTATVVDNEGFISVLKKEGIDGTGLLSVDTRPHLIAGTYTGGCTTGHSWNAGIKTAESTCTEAGSITYTCNLCGETKTEELPLAAHRYQITIVSPTTTAQGYHQYTCMVCGETYRDSYTPVLDSCTAYTDIDRSAWYHEAVDYVLQAGLMVGINEESFSPGGKMTRAMLVTVLYRMEKAPAVTASSPFHDLTADWYKNAAIWANTVGIITGTGGSSFSPNRNITRQEIAAILHRYAKWKGILDIEPTALDSFPDAGLVMDFAREPFGWAVGAGIVTGAQSGNAVLLNPRGEATRAEVASMLQRFNRAENT